MYKRVHLTVDTGLNLLAVVASEAVGTPTSPAIFRILITIASTRLTKGNSIGRANICTWTEIIWLNSQCQLKFDSNCRAKQTQVMQ